MNKMDADRLRMQGQLENRLQKIRKGRRDSKLKEVLSRSEQIKEELKEKIDSEEDKLNAEVADKLKETLNIKSSIDFPPTPNSPPSIQV